MERSLIKEIVIFSSFFLKEPSSLHALRLPGIVTVLLYLHTIGITQGYWRAAKAHKELGQVDFALDAAIGGYNVSVNQNQEEEIISFLVEIVSIIITLRR